MIVGSSFNKESRLMRCNQFKYISYKNHYSCLNAIVVPTDVLQSVNFTNIVNKKTLLFWSQLLYIPL